MSDMSASRSIDFGEAEAVLRRMRRPLVLTHAKPDGDAIGAVQAVCLRCRELRADPRPVLFDPVPARYESLLRHGALPVWGRDADPAAIDQADGIVVVDTCARAQIEPLFERFVRSGAPKLIVDHHVTRDLEADTLLIDPSASATCLILQEWAAAEEWSMTAALAESLLTGVATDTGWFRHANTDGRTLSAAGELAWHGVRPHELFERTYLRGSVGRFRLRTVALQSLELLADEQLAVMVIPRSAFSECGATTADTEDLINEPFLMSGVRASVMLVEHDAGVVRVGLRSREPSSPADPDVDVAELARRLGGGGHCRAAGARVQGTLEDVRARVLSEVVPRLPPVRGR